MKNLKKIIVEIYFTHGVLKNDAEKYFSDNMRKSSEKIILVEHYFIDIVYEIIHIMYTV